LDLDKAADGRNLDQLCWADAVEVARDVEGSAWREEYMWSDQKGRSQSGAGAGAGLGQGRERPFS
jgi:hypothetical protein